MALKHALKFIFCIRMYTVWKGTIKNYLKNRHDLKEQNIYYIKQCNKVFWVAQNSINK